MSHSHLPHDLAFEAALKSIKQAGLKLTSTRRALLRILLQEHGPFSIEELQNKLDDSCDIVTIYRNMTAFMELGFVNACDFGEGHMRYEWQDPEHQHHHHIVCQNCRQVEELEHCVVEELEALISKRGYAQVSHRLEFYGICQSCQELAHVIPS